MWSLLFLLTLPMADPKSEIKDDEVVVFYPTYAYQVDDGRAWSVQIHGAIFEPEEDSLRRRATLGLLRRALGLERGETETELFKTRARAFLVDNERGKRITVRLGDKVYEAGTSAANGHFGAVLTLPDAEVRRLSSADPERSNWLSFQAVTRPDDRRTFAGRVQLIGARGLSVISDVDDTIKISMVTDRRALVRNTFLRPFKPVEGMAALYRKWAEAGAAFHYVSASPWQLYGPLSQFLGAQGFPPGSFHLKLVRLKDASALELFSSQERYKTKAIERILGHFPDRRFVLVGDCGEQDPEIYGALARKHPDQVVRILIRSVDGSTREHPRYQAAFESIPDDGWQVFGDAEELGEVLPTVPPQP
jgi:hypothetical protein